MNRVDRLVAMILLLQHKRSITADQVATHFEVSVRTVYRDIVALSEAGVPIIAEAGVGYRLMPGYSLPPVMFTQEEAQALATGGVLVGSLTDPALDKIMESALMKISAVLPDTQKESLKRLKRKTSILNKQAENSKTQTLEIPLIQQALVEQRSVIILYSDSHGNASQREIEPKELVHYLDRWHLLARCKLRKADRDFRLDRIEHIELTNNHYEIPLSEKKTSYLEKWLKAETQSTARVKMEKWAVDKAEREWMLGVEIVSDDNVINEDGTVEVLLHTCELSWLVNWLLSFGTGLKVIEPPELAEMIRTRALELAEHHDPHE